MEPIVDRADFPASYECARAISDDMLWYREASEETIQIVDENK